MKMEPIEYLLPAAIEPTDWRYAEPHPRAEAMLAAYKLLLSIPEGKFAPQLNYYYVECYGTRHEFNMDKPFDEVIHNCGTLACGAGWLGITERFKRNRQAWESWAMMHFATDHNDLFAWSGGSCYDYEATSRGLNEKERLLYRFRRAMGHTRREALRTMRADLEALKR